MSERKKRTLPIVIIATPLLVLVVLLAIEMFAGGSAHGTLSTGRSISTYTDSMFLSARFASDTATIKTAGKTIIVEPTELSIDGTIVANINEGVSKVEVRAMQGTITFVADGKSVQTVLR